MDKDREQPEPLRAAGEVAQQRPLADIRVSKAALAGEVEAMKQWVLDRAANQMKLKPANLKNRKILTSYVTFSFSTPHADQAELNISLRQDVPTIRTGNVDILQRMERIIREEMRGALKEHIEHGVPCRVDDFDRQKPQHLLTITTDSLKSMKAVLGALAPTQMAQR